MEREKTNKRTANVKTLLCVLTLVIMFALLLWRVPFGYDWTDEQYYSAIGYRLLQGDRPLVDTWEVHQFSAMLSAPVLQVYIWCNGGSTEGMVLFLRYFAVSLQFCASLVAFFMLKKRNGLIPALLVAGMLQGYSHFAINSYYYDSMVLLFGTLSGLFCMEFFQRSKGGFLFSALGGLFFALAVVAFPYALLVTPVYLAYWIVRMRVNGGRKQNELGLVAFVLGAAVVALILLIFLLSRASVSQLLAGVSNMLGDPDHQTQSLLEVTGQYFNAIRVVYSPVSYGAAALLLLGIAFSFSKNENVRRSIHCVGAVSIVLMLFGVVWIALRYDWNGIYRINLLAMGFAMLAPGFFFLSKRTRDNGTLLLYWIGCMLSFAVQLGSNTRILASSGMLLPASMAAVLYLFEHANELFLFKTQKSQNTENRLRLLSKVLRVTAALACVACVVGLMFLRLTAVHRDEPIPQLTATIGSGAAKGIRTTEESAALHDELIANICEYAPSSGTILITNLFPEGYLVTGSRAATPSTFNMSMDSAWLAQYYEQHPERVPVFVFALNPTMPYNEDGQKGIDSFSNNPSYERRDFATGTAFVKTGS